MLHAFNTCSTWFQQHSDNICMHLSQCLRMCWKQGGKMRHLASIGVDYVWLWITLWLSARLPSSQFYNKYEGWVIVMLNIWSTQHRWCDGTMLHVVNLMKEQAFAPATLHCMYPTRLSGRLGGCSWPCPSSTFCLWGASDRFSFIQGDSHVTYVQPGLFSHVHKCILCCIETLFSCRKCSV